MKVYIRPHHLICMQGFQGYGYSKEFVKNMSRIINILRCNLDIEIQLVKRCDDICLACPNNNFDGYSRENRCIDEKKINKMDDSILQKLRLKEGQTLKINREGIFEFVNKRIKNKENSCDICGNCSWREVCLWFKDAQVNMKNG